MRVRRERVKNASLLKLMVVVTLAAVAQGDPLSACDALHQKYAKGVTAREAREAREAWVSGRAHALRVFAGARAPARAAAALLAAGLRHRLRYRVALRLLPATSLCRLASSLYPTRDARGDDDHADEPYLALVPAAAWGAAARCAALRGADAGALPPQLRVAGPGAAPARLRLHAHLTREASSRPPCQNAARWSFYTNDTTLQMCSFLRDDPAATKRHVRMYYPEERRAVATRLATKAARFGLRLRPVALGFDSAPRRELLKLLHEGKDSFLFLDYEIWSNLDRVHRIDPPPDENELDLAHTVRLADTWILRQVAPDILQAFHKFEPTPDDLRAVLEIEAGRPDSNITEAACEVALHNSRFDEWFDGPTETSYEVLVFLCEEDPDIEEHIRVLIEAYPAINEVVKPSFRYELNSMNVSCGDEHALMRALVERAQGVHWARLAGALAAGEAGEAAAAAAGALDAALLLYAPAAGPAPGARAATARLDHLARALTRFVTRFGWTRLAVLSERSHLASALVRSLKAPGDLRVLDVPIDSSPKSALQFLLKSNARIIFVNSNSSVALSVLCAARDSEMTPEAGYVWILREWHFRKLNMTCRRGPLIRSHLTISLWWRGGSVPLRLNGTIVRNTLDATWPGGDWPPYAAPLVDALNLLLRGFQNFLQNHPERQYDLHGGNATRLFWEDLEKQSIQGVTQTFEWDKYGIKNPLVYIDEWHGNRRDPLAVWRVKDNEIKEVYSRRLIFSDNTPSDGATFCLIKSDRDSFSPKCHDGACFTALACVVLALPALALARRERARRLRRRRRALAARLLDLAGPLAALLVDRAALDLRAELGAGRFGLVRAAVLRTAGRALDVAAKTLRDESTPAEEREFLNEAVTLASLRHERVVRLVGVCVGGGPPLVLMPRAFFRDLLRYLRARRPLARAAAAAAAADAEAAHVAPAALTRLARQAAAALAYLSAQGVVHRDVRAANCLVDSRRSLQLADFGLARRTAAGGEYASRRRGPLPVPWMAPESLERGAFSAASDAWGLGVLLLELLTLGEPPYGAWPPQRVLRYVGAGGRPPLPADVTPEMRRVLASCWRRAATERATAATLATCLAAHPELVVPAFEPTEYNDPDSRG